MGALKKIPSSDVICADVRLVNISHQFDLPCWFFLFDFPGQHCLSISCLFNLPPPPAKMGGCVWCNKWSDGNMIIERSLMAIWEGLEVPFSSFCWIMLDNAPHVMLCVRNVEHRGWLNSRNVLMTPCIKTFINMLYIGMQLTGHNWPVVMLNTPQ